MGNKKIKQLFFGAILVTMVFLVATYDRAQGESLDELKNEISDKTKNLDEINKQLKVVSQVYEETQDKSKSLKQELSKIDSNIKQLDLHIKSGQINIEKMP
jgi:septal ring factor EnvC (AmiA/AmiB activator)